MRINWKLLAGFSLFGAAISLISGIAGGNPFGIILLRLVLSAIVFAALGLGVQAVLRRYVPDLLHNAPQPERAAGDSVDIIIDDEVPLSSEAGAPEPPGRGAESAGEAGEVEEILTEPAEEAVLGMEPAAETEEPEEAPGETAGFQSVDFPGLEDEASVSALFDRESDAEAPAGGRRGPPQESPRDQLETTADLEVLPEIDSLEEGEGPESSIEPGGTGQGDAGPSARRAPSTPREMRQAQIEETVKDQDPENLARAVRTFLKKDQ